MDATAVGADCALGQGGELGGGVGVEELHVHGRNAAVESAVQGRPEGGRQVPRHLRRRTWGVAAAGGRQGPFSSMGVNSRDGDFNSRFLMDLKSFHEHRTHSGGFVHNK